MNKLDNLTRALHHILHCVSFIILMPISHFNHTKVDISLLESMHVVSQAKKN